MESKKINQLATELSPELSDLTIIGDPNTGISKKITLSQMASLFTGTVEEYASLSAFPLVGAADTIYIALDTNIIYRWNTGTSAYVELSPNIVTSLVFNDANGFDGTISLIGSTATLTITTALTTGSVGFIGASGALLEDNANFFWNNSTKRLGINTNAPTTALDVFGSGIIGRVNGTSTNNAFIGFASAGSNKWSIGNVQSDHRFRIYNEATTSELISVLQTGEFGIGIANPTTKLHIDGGASALIANLDANVSVAKSISFRSDNSNRINLEVSGTESGSNAGANFFIRRYSDAGALIDTPLTITRSTGNSIFGGNVGIGATLSAWISTAKVLQLNNSASLYAPTDENILANNVFVDSGDNNKYINTNFASQYRQVNGQHLFYTAASGTAGNTISFGSPKLTIAASGSATFTSDVSISTSSTSYGSAFYLINTSNSKQWNFTTVGSGISGRSGNLEINNNAADILAITQSGNLGIGTTTPSAKITLIGGEMRWGFTSDMGALSYTGGNPMIQALGALSLLFATNGSERMRINSTGEVGIGVTASTGNKFWVKGVDSGTGNSAIVATNSSDTLLLLVRNDGNTRMNASVFNNTTSGTSRTVYIGNGDYYLGGVSSIKKSKKNIQEFTSKWIYDLKPVQFNYRKKDEKGNYTEEIYEEINYGLIAEDTAPIADFLINYNDKEDGSKEMVGIEYSRLITPMLKEIQELKKEIELLKSK